VTATCSAIAVAHVGLSVMGSEKTGTDSKQPVRPGTQLSHPCSKAGDCIENADNGLFLLVSFIGTLQCFGSVRLGVLCWCGAQIFESWRKAA